MKGRLLVCATPIGNLDDVTIRVLKALGEVDLVVCEDTRRTRKLLARHGIRARTVSYHDGNEREQTPRLVAKIRGGAEVALVSDSGTPAVSDPGYALVRACLDSGLPVEALPGPSAALAALVVSGLPTDRFVFEGFLPRKEFELRRRLEALSGEERTLVLFEAPSRVLRTLEVMREVFGERPMALARELTKVHEEVIRGSVSEVLGSLAGREPVGEMVLVVGGAPREADFEGAVVRARALVGEGRTRSRAAAEAARSFGVERRAVYAALGDHSAENGSQV